MFRQCVLLLMINSVLGCTNNHKDFYSYNVDMDLHRFPLIEPYEIVSSNRKESWSFIFEDKTLCRYTCYMTNIDSVSISDNIILVHTEASLDFHGTGWLVIDSKSNFKKFYKDYSDTDEFKAKLKELGALYYKSYPFKDICLKFQESLVLPPEWHNKKKK